MSREIRKQVSMYLPLNEWRIIRNESINQGVTMTELMRSWMKPHLELIRLNSGTKPST